MLAWPGMNRFEICRAEGCSARTRNDKSKNGQHEHEQEDNLQ